MSSASPDSLFRITSGSLEGFLDPSRFGPASRSLCIRVGPSDPWMTPTEFESLSGKGSQHNWKRTIRSKSHDGKMLAKLIEDGLLNMCKDRHCLCPPCQLSKSRPRSNSPTTAATDDLLAAKVRDNDSDSGISVDVGNTVPKVEPQEEAEVDRKPLVVSDNDLVYTSIVQEAICGLSSKEGDDQGCSLLGILLYILHHHKPTEPIDVVHTKVKSSLALLQRMGIVNRVQGDSSDDDEEDEVKFDNLKPSQTDPATKRKEPKSKVLKVVKTESKPSKANSAPKKSNAIVKQQTKQKKVVKRKEKENRTTEGGQKSHFPFHLQKPKNLSPALAAVCGKKQMSRHEAVRSIWKYIKTQQLQDPQQRNVVVCDKKMRAVTKKESVTCAEVLTCLGQHMTAIT